MTLYSVHSTGNALNDGAALQNRLTNQDSLGLLVGGDIVELDANAEYMGPIGLPVLNLASPVTIRTVGAATNFPLNTNGYKRVAPDGLANPGPMGAQIGGHSNMAKLTAPDQFHICLYCGNTGGSPDPAGSGTGLNASGANNWTFLGVEFKAHANNSWTGFTQNSAFELVQFLLVGNNADSPCFSNGNNWILAIASRPTSGTFTLTYQGNTVTVAWPSPFNANTLANNILQAGGGAWSSTSPKLLGSFTTSYFQNNYGYAGEGILMQFGDAAMTPVTLGTAGLSGGSLSLVAPYYQGTQGTNAPLMWPQSMNDASQLPNNIVFDRCIFWSGFKGATGQEIRHGLQLHAKAVTVKNSYLYDFKGTGSDVQAINGFNGCGPYSLLNNYIEAATECVIFGGTQPTITNMQLGAFGAGQSLVQYNLIGHNPAWNANDPSWDGSNWTIKNLFELKAGGNIKIDNNTFQHSWIHRDQLGHCILMTPRAVPSNLPNTAPQGAPWIQIHDAIITNNHFVDAYSGLEITATDPGGDTGAPTTQAGIASSAILIQDNLFEDLGNFAHTGGVVALKTTVNAGGGVAAGVNTWSPAFVPGSVDVLHPSPGAQIDPKTGMLILGSGQTATIQVGSKICFGYPDHNVVPYIFNPDFELAIVTSTNPGAGTFTCTNAKSHSGTVNLGIATDEGPGGGFPRFFSMDGGFTATDNGSNMTIGVTVDHNTVTTSRMSMNGSICVIGGDNSYRSFYGNFSHENFLFNNNLVCCLQYGMNQLQDRNTNVPLAGGTGAPKVFQELSADGTCSIRNNLFYLTAQAIGAGATGTDPGPVVKGWLTAPTSLSGGMVSPAGYSGPLYLGSGSADTNLYQLSYTGVFFSNWNGGAGGDYSLGNGSPAKRAALDGTDIGCRNFAWYTDGNGPNQGHVSTPSTTTATSANITSPANEVSTVTVTGSGGTPSGQVIATLDGGSQMTQTLAGGMTSFTWPSPSVGTHTIAANYQGDSVFATSSGTATFTVASPTGTRSSRIFVAMQRSIVSPTNEICTVTVADNSGQGGTPTGNVIATLDNGAPVTQTLVGGQTTFTFARPLVGPHTIALNYQGDGTWAASQTLQSFTVTSPPLTPSQVTLATSSITSPANEPVVVTVSAGQGYTGTPTGQVVATLDNGSQATQTLVGGQTTFAYPSPAVGTHQVAVSYKGDATFDVSTGQGSFRVQASGGPGQPAQDSGVSGFRNAAAVVPSDNTDLPTPALALYIGATGAVVLNMLNGQTVTLSALQAGTFVYLNITRVKSTGTTAGSLVALW